MVVDLQKAKEMMAATEGHHTIVDSIAKTAHVLAQYDSVCCSVSGGADSDIILDLCAKLDKNRVVKYVFFNTGLEYQATKDHLDDLEERYQIQIDRVRPEKPIPLACREYGVPFLSKYVSCMMGRLQRHAFDWSEQPFEVLVQRYPYCISALKWWTNGHDDPESGKSMFNISRNPGLKEFITQNPPTFAISDKCCFHAKKKPATVYDHSHGIELKILGLRQGEGGYALHLKPVLTKRKKALTNSSRFTGTRRRIKRDIKNYSVSDTPPATRSGGSNGPAVWAAPSTLDMKKTPRLQSNMNRN